MPRILLVDDDINVLRALGRLIHFMPRELLGGEVEVECHSEPEDALARAAACEFDLIVVDYLMPRMHGVAFMRRLNAMHSHAARLLLTAHARALEKIDAVKGIGPVEMMSKPWDEAALKAAIARLVGWRRGQLAARLQAPAQAPLHVGLQAPGAVLLTAQ
ncbi:MAG: response regulator [Xanthomonadales bacterium]|nr:response regulator [Xanthomonadales bacterium]